MHATSRPSRLLAYNHMLQALTQLVPLLESIERRDRDLGNQLRRAAASVTLNLAESCGYSDGNRLARRRTALGSLWEVIAALETSVALRYVGAQRCEAVMRELRRIAAMVAGLCG